MNRSLALAVVLFGLLNLCVADDLAKVDRAILKEPKYTGKPWYGLMVFGPATAFRVWLVHDGNTLYVDKNGNGDLTEPDERVAGESDGIGFTFRVGTIRVGALEHRSLIVRAHPIATFSELAKHPVAEAALKKDKSVNLMNVSAEVEAPGFKGAGDGGRLSVSARIDSNGPLLFTDTPREAPVLHFGGPLHLRAETARPKLYRDFIHDLMLMAGTPGIGPGTFASVGYENLIPETAFIVVEGEFKSKDPDARIKERYELKERC